MFQQFEQFKGKSGTKINKTKTLTMVMDEVKENQYKHLFAQTDKLKILGVY